LTRSTSARCWSIGAPRPGGHANARRPEGIARNLCLLARDVHAPLCGGRLDIGLGYAQIEVCKRNSRIDASAITAGISDCDPGRTLSAQFDRQGKTRRRFGASDAAILTRPRDILRLHLNLRIGPEASYGASGTSRAQVGARSIDTGRAAPRDGAGTFEREDRLIGRRRRCGRLRLRDRRAGRYGQQGRDDTMHG
jgi:hypothetical protein